MIDNQPNPETDYVSLRGIRLRLAELVDPRIFDDTWVSELRQRFGSAVPFAHLRVQDLFNPDLLELVAEEFESIPGDSWRTFDNHYERTFRSAPDLRMGPASELYFGIVNSGYFVHFLSQVSGVADLIVDHKLFGGGLHESRNGGKFEVHSDFDRHAGTGLRNEMVLLTYLNKDWDAKWGGELELWDAGNQRCMTRIVPDFGVSLLMKNGAHHFHGHPNPLNMPEGRVRRSLATYYYSNPESIERAGRGRSTVFANAGLGESLRSSATQIARYWAPPALWNMLRQVRRRFGTRR